jgi:hypothetical protein
MSPTLYQISAVKMEREPLSERLLHIHQVTQRHTSNIALPIMAAM